MENKGIVCANSASERSIVTLIYSLQNENDELSRIRDRVDSLDYRLNGSNDMLKSCEEPLPCKEQPSVVELLTKILDKFKDLNATIRTTLSKIENTI